MTQRFPIISRWVIIVNFISMDYLKIVTRDTSISFTCHQSQLNIHITCLYSIKPRYRNFIILGNISLYIGITIKNCNISPIHFGVFIHNNHSPSTIITCGATVTFSNSNICNKILSNSIITDSISNFYVASIHIVISRIHNIIGTSR